MADANELAFVKAQLNTLGSLPIQFADDYQQPPSNSLKKIPIIPIPLPPPPPPKSSISEASSSDTIELNFKVTKPAFTFNLVVSPTDTISSIKEQLSTQPGAPPAEAQRLLLRGKALADNKLLREYPVKKGDTVNLILKPGFDWDWTATKTKDSDGDVQMALSPESTQTERKERKSGGHQRIPSLVLHSPSLSPNPLPGDNPPSPIPITLDASTMPSMSETAILDPYHMKLKSPDFWLKLHDFLKSEFDSPADATQAFELFLRGCKCELSPSDVPKIRDATGILGMNGS